MEYGDILTNLRELVDKSIIEQESGLKKIVDNSDFKVTQLRKQLKVFQDEEKNKTKLEKKKNSESDSFAKKMEKSSIEDILEENYLDCFTSVFTQAIELDMYKKSIDAYAKRICELNKIVTFKDNKSMFIYSNKEGIYFDGGDIIISEQIQKELKEEATDNTVKEILNKIRRKTFVDREILNKQPKKYQPVGNGLLNLETGLIEEFTHKYIYFTKINIDFNKDAVCPTFHKFLDTSLDNNKESKFMVQEWLGNLLLNDNRFQRALLLFGAKGENGKSVLLKVIGKFLGHKNFCSISLQALEKNQFALARLSTKRANIFFDLPKAALSQTSNFKLITAGDPVTGEFKGQDSFEFYPMTKMMFSCNEVPRTPDRTAAFFRRWLIIQFNQTFPEGDERRIENLDDLISSKEELEGILQFAYKGLQRLYANKKFTENMNPLEIREFWLKKSDSIASFSMDSLETSTDGEWISKRDVYGMYQTYCEEQGYEPLSENVFFKGLKDFMNIEDFRPSIITKDNTQMRVQALKVKRKIKKTMKDEVIEMFRDNPHKDFAFNEIPNLMILEDLVIEGKIKEVSPNCWRWA